MGLATKTVSRRDNIINNLNGSSRDRKMCLKCSIQREREKELSFAMACGKRGTNVH